MHATIRSVIDRRIADRAIKIIAGLPILIQISNLPSQFLHSFSDAEAQPKR